MANVTVDGDGNLVASRDLIITVKDVEESDKRLSSVVEKKLKGIDVMVATYMPSGIVSSRSKNSVAFSSELMIESLGNLGVPLTAAIDVVNDSAQLLIEKSNIATEVTTRDLRTLVIESLYSLNENKYGKSKVEKWGDSYVRRYGSDTYVKVIHADGTESDLRYEYLMDKVIPELIDSITGDVAFLKNQGEIISIGATRRMANEMIHIVSSLNVYYIHYDTLMSVFRDVSLQPPHPWFSTRVREFSYVNYDYEKYKRNARKSQFFSEAGELKKAVRATKESIHHLCSAYLSYYSVYLGCGYLAPLYVLENIASKVNRDEADDLNMMFRLSEMEPDLVRTGHSVEKLHTVLRLLIKQLKGTNRITATSLKDLRRASLHLKRIVNGVLSSFIRLERLRQIEITQSSDTDVDLRDLLLCFPRIDWTWHKSNNAYWITHDYEGRVFSDAKKNILFVEVQEGASLREVVPFWVDEMLLNSKLCNTIIFLTKHPTEMAISLVSSAVRKDNFIVSLSVMQLLTIALSDSPDVAMADYIMNQQ